MSAISELRARLDARGVDHLDYHDATEWGNGAFCAAGVYATDVVCGFRLKDDKLVIRRVMTPAEAVEATLGRETCRMEQIEEACYDDIECSECGVCLWGFQMDKQGESVLSKPKFCPNCGREVVE